MFFIEDNEAQQGKLVTGLRHILSFRGRANRSEWAKLAGLLLVSAIIDIGPVYFGADSMLADLTPDSFASIYLIPLASLVLTVTVLGAVYVRRQHDMIGGKKEYEILMLVHWPHLLVQFMSHALVPSAPVGNQHGRPTLNPYSLKKYAVTLSFIVLLGCASSILPYILYKVHYADPYGLSGGVYQDIL